MHSNAGAHDRGSPLHGEVVATPWRFLSARNGLIQVVILMVCARLFAIGTRKAIASAGDYARPERLVLQQTGWPNHTLKPAEQLRKMYEAASLTRDKEIIVCGQVGFRAMNTVFILTLLGYDRLCNNEGSWQDRGHRPDLPIAR